MTKKITIFAALFLLLSAGLVQSQNIADRQRRLGMDQDRTSEIIRRARSIVAESGSIRARNLLEAAVRLHSKSIELSNLDLNSFGEQYMLQAGKLTFSAREKAQRSIAITRQAQENEDNVRRRIEMATEHLRRAEELIGLGSPSGIQQLLESARQKLDRAREFFLDRRLRAALQMLQQTENSLGKIRGKMGGSADARQRYERLLERFFSARERIAGAESSGPSIMERLDKMDQMLIQAQKRAETDDYSGAVRLLEKAVNQIKRMTEQMKAPPRVISALERARRHAELISQEVAVSPNQRVQNTYSDIRRHLDRAGQLAENRQFDRAAAQIQVANQLLVRLTQMLRE